MEVYQVNLLELFVTVVVGCIAYPWVGVAYCVLLILGGPQEAPRNDSTGGNEP